MAHTDGTASILLEVHARRPQHPWCAKGYREHSRNPKEHVMTVHRNIDHVTTCARGAQARGGTRAPFSHTNAAVVP